MNKFIIYPLYALFIVTISIFICKNYFCDKNISDEIQTGSVISDQIINEYKRKGNDINLRRHFSDKYTTCFINDAAHAKNIAVKLFPRANMKFMESDDSNGWYFVKYNSDSNNLYIYKPDSEKLEWNVENNEETNIGKINYETTCTTKIRIIEKNNKYYINPVKE